MTPEEARDLARRLEHAAHELRRDCPVLEDVLTVLEVGVIEISEALGLDVDELE